MRIVFFTGAGISKESGVDTFRGPDGTWNAVDVKKVAHINSWRHGNRQEILKFHDQLRNAVKAAKPNLAHTTIADLHNQGHDVWVVTQNVDDLHERGGMPNERVIHLHGEIMYATDGISKSLVTEDMYNPEVIKPSVRPCVVWFGEVPENIDYAHEIAESADLIVIIGTTLKVWPAAGVVFTAGEHKQKILIDPNKPEDFNKLKHLTWIKENATTGIENWVKTYDIISNILQKQELGNIENTLDYIFNIFDDLIIEQKFDIINLLFDIIEIDKLNLELIIGILTITSQYSDKFTSRNAFYNKAFKITNEKYNTEETNKILHGL